MERFQSIRQRFLRKYRRRALRKSCARYVTLLYAAVRLWMGMLLCVLTVIASYVLDSPAFRVQNLRSIAVLCAVLLVDLGTIYILSLGESTVYYTYGQISCSCLCSRPPGVTEQVTA